MLSVEKGRTLAAALEHAGHSTGFKNNERFCALAPREREQLLLTLLYAQWLHSFKCIHLIVVHVLLPLGWG